jgi:hypothetical protein
MGVPFHSSKKKKKKKKTSWNALQIPNFFKSKKFNVCQSTGKVTTFVFWDTKGAIHTEFMPQGTINANT